MLDFLKLKNALVFIVFGVISSVTMFHHEMWLDEAQAFLLSRDSDGLKDLWINLRYEGHTGVWHVLVYGLLKVWSSPLSVQILHLLIGLSIIWIILFKIKIPLSERVLLGSSYFFLYEYMILSRNYALGILFILLATQAILKWKGRWMPLVVAVLLSIAMNTSFPALLVSSALFIALCMDRIVRWRKGDCLNLYVLIISCCIVGFSIILAYLELRPFPDRALDSTPDLTFNFFKVLHVLKKVGQSIFLVPTEHWNRPWDWQFNSGLTGMFAIILEHACFVLPVLALSTLLLTLFFLVRKIKIAVFFLILGISMLFIFNYAVRVGGVRHHGFYFLVIVCTYWIWTENDNDQERNNLTYYSFRTIFFLLLGFQALSSAYYHQADIRYVFSDAKGVANFLIENKLVNKPTLFSPQYAGPPVMWYSQASNGFYVETGKYQSFLVYTRKAKMKIHQQDVLQSASQINSNVLVFLDNWETLNPNDSLILKSGYHLAYRTESERILTPGEERFRVYIKSSVE